MPANPISSGLALILHLAIIAIAYVVNMLRGTPRNTAFVMDSTPVHGTARAALKSVVAIAIVVLIATSSALFFLGALAVGAQEGRDEPHMRFLRSLSVLYDREQTGMYDYANTLESFTQTTNTTTPALLLAHATL